MEYSEIAEKREVLSRCMCVHFILDLVKTSLTNYKPGSANIVFNNWIGLLKYLHTLYTLSRYR